MTLTLYVPTPSPLHRLHPVTKLVVLAAFVVAAFVVDEPAYLLPIAAAVAVLLAVAGALGVVRRFVPLFVLVFVFTLVVWTLFFRGLFVPTREGFLFGLSTAIRLDTFLAAGLLFLATTRVEEVAYALGRLGVPYKVGFTLTLAFRLVPLFFESAATIVQAQRCRGLRMDEGGVVTRLRRFVPVIVPVFVGALRRADRMAMALELRGFDSGRPRTTYLRARAGVRDAVAAALALAGAAIYVALWLHGAGVIRPEAGAVSRRGERQSAGAGTPAPRGSAARQPANVSAVPLTSRRSEHAPPAPPRPRLHFASAPRVALVRAPSVARAHSRAQLVCRAGFAGRGMQYARATRRHTLAPR